ncbi:sigma factor-like helix-turn-helix DNA-binding protein [Nonomuraea harbinensis]|uniref:Sigma factor-like helix-turn-helix DNA-binding protein n=1 Tax=Nonomuraea harbinensis TaxID=1286938 RepID=A0ABW1C3C1_9ACTN|nr:sigma factor-like helix-turn-helix DNA-binding protein [Nonomuraea harbinensis]
MSEREGRADPAGPLDRAGRVDSATEAFVAHRNLLFTVVHEMLGSAADAEDVLQESWLRWVDVELAESVSMAMLLVLETLQPTERAVFVLREVFELDYDEIAEAVGKSPNAVRQIAYRARAHVAARRPRGIASPAETRAALQAVKRVERDAERSVELVQINGGPGLLVRVDGEIDGVVAVRVENGYVTGAYHVRNPEKLSRVERETAVTR